MLIYLWNYLCHVCKTQKCCLHSHINGLTVCKSLHFKVRAFQSQFKVTFTVGWGQSGTRYCCSYSKSSGYECDSMQCPLKSWYTTMLCESVCEREKGVCVNPFFHYQIHITQPDTYCRGQRPALTLNKWDDLADPLRCTHTHAHTHARSQTNSSVCNFPMHSL